MNKAAYDTIKAVKDKTFKSGDNFFSAKNDGIGYGKLGDVVPKSAKDAADAALNDIKSGKITPKDAVQIKG